MSDRAHFLKRHAIKERVNQGAKLSVVAREFGLTYERIRQIVGRRTPPGRPPQINWDPESISVARRLWDDGLTASQIAVGMGVTRNSIIGIAYRNDFPARPSPIRRRAA